MPTARPTRTASGWDCQRALEATIVQVERRYGRGAIWRLDADQPVPPVPVISTGSLALDQALGVGGLPRGRISEVYGPEATGKTTLALSVVAQAQQAGGTALFMEPSTPWTWPTPKRSGSMPTGCCCASPTPVSTPWRCWRCSSAPAPWPWP
jgi:recA bacterial DNA recombination protein